MIDTPTRLARRLCLAVSLALCLLLSGCSWFDWILGDSTPDDESSETSQSAEASEQESGQEATMESTTMADRRLERIYKKQQDILALIAAKQGEMNLLEQERLIQNLLSEYQTFTYENPEFVYGYILYGKLLRQVGDREGANVAFAKANRLDPQIAVVKQQLGNYLAEQGDWETALRYFASAAELEPDNAVYQYQIGEMLYQNRNRLIYENNMPPDVFEAEMLKAFRKAAELDPSNRTFQMRYAETFFDVENPNWGGALYLWNHLEKGAETPLERDIIRMQKARVLLKMDRKEQAEAILVIIEQPTLESSRQELLRQARQ